MRSARCVRGGEAASRPQQCTIHGGRSESRRFPVDCDARHSTSGMALLMTTSPRVPVLSAGDKLTRDEFERRYAAMPDLKKAELIEGVVYMGSAVRYRQHGRPEHVLAAWLAFYESHTPGLGAAHNSTVRLDLDNEPQPD